MWRAPVGWNRWIEVDDQFVLAVSGIAVGWVVGRWFEEAQEASCLKVCVGWHHQVDTVAVDALVEVVGFDAVLVLQQRRMELARCEGEDSLEERTAAVGIVVLLTH